MSRKAKRNGGDDIKMSDIARHAGVSPMTVSRYVEGATLLSPWRSRSLAVRDGTV